MSSFFYTVANKDEIDDNSNQFITMMYSGLNEE